MMAHSMWYLDCLMLHTAACQNLLGIPATTLHLQHPLDNFLLFDQECSDDPAAAMLTRDEQQRGDTLQQ